MQSESRHSYAGVPVLDLDEKDPPFSTAVVESLPPRNGPRTNSLIEPSKFGARLGMILFVLLAIVAGLGHHFFLNYLNHRPADGGVFNRLRSVFHVGISDQSAVNFISNQMAKICISNMGGAIAIAYVQVFWWTLRRETTTLRRIDAVDSFAKHPVNLKRGWQALGYMTWVALVTVVAWSADQLSSITPGALTVETTNLPTSCSVPTVDLSQADLSGHKPRDPNGNWVYGGVNGRAVSLFMQVLMSGAYATPSSPCGICTYDIQFVAPAVKCDNITQATDIASILTTSVEDGYTRVWDGQYDSTLEGFRIASRNIEGPSSQQQDIVPVDQSPVIALQCTGWNATYDVHVSQGANTTVTVNSVQLGQQLTLDKLATASNPWDHQLLALWDAFAWQLRGGVSFYFTNNFDNDPAYIAWGAVARGSDVGIAWHWAGDLEKLMPEMMQNVSLSLLTGSLSDTRNTTLRMQDTTCIVSALVYVYNPMRLLGPYIAGLVATLGCIFIGILAIRTNRGQEETLGFSRILAAHPPLPKSGGESPNLTLDTPVRIPLDGQEYGRFEAVSGETNC